MDGLDLVATYTYLDAEKTSSVDIQLPRAPVCRAGLEMKSTSLHRTFGAKNSERRSGAKLVNAREELNFGGPNFDIEDYSFVNFAAEYEVNWYLTVFGRIDNLTNEHYSEVFGFPNAGPGCLCRHEGPVLVIPGHSERSRGKN